METKWYSDIWQLIVAPFKRGIPQIVEHGGAAANALFSLPSKIAGMVGNAVGGVVGKVK